ncbi:MAG: hypothetical protein ACKO3R_05500 [bacterium]
MSAVVPLRPKDEIHPQDGDQQGFMAVSKLPITATNTTNKAGTAKAITMHLPPEDRQSSTFGSQNLNFQNEVPEIKFKSKELMALLIDDTMTNQQKFTVIEKDPTDYGLSRALIMALEQDVINKDQSKLFSQNHAYAQSAKASQIITRLNSSPLQLIMSLDNLNPEKKLEQIRDGAIVDQKFLSTLPQDAAEAVALIQQKMIYKPISDKMKAKDLTLKRNFSPNPNSPTGEHMLSELTLKYGDLPEITIEWKIPKGIRSAEEIREALEADALREEFTKQATNTLAEEFSKFSENFSQKDKQLADSLNQRITEVNPEITQQKRLLETLDPVFNTVIESGLTTLSKEQLIQKFFTQLNKGLKTEESTENSRYGEIFATFSKNLTKDQLSVKMKEAMNTVIKENFTPTKISEILNPNRYESLEEYQEAVERNKHLGPEMQLSEDLQTKYKNILEAGHGKGHNDANIPESQLVTQRITVNTENPTELEFLPNKGVPGKEVKMPGGVVVHTAGATAKGTSPSSFNLRSSSEKFRLEINNGIISLFGVNKDGEEKLTAQINPSGVTLLFDENIKNNRTAFTLPTANAPRTDRAREHFNSSSANTILENSFESKQSETRTAQGTYKSLFQIKMVFWYKMLSFRRPLPYQNNPLTHLIFIEIFQKKITKYSS